MEIETSKTYRLSKKEIDGILESWLRETHSDYSDYIEIDWAAGSEVVIKTSDAEQATKE